MVPGKPSIIQPVPSGTCLEIRKGSLLTDLFTQKRESSDWKDGAFMHAHVKWVSDGKSSPLQNPKLSTRRYRNSLLEISSFSVVFMGKHFPSPDRFHHNINQQLIWGSFSFFQETISLGSKFSASGELLKENTKIQIYTESTTNFPTERAIERLGYDNDKDSDKYSDSGGDDWLL